MVFTNEELADSSKRIATIDPKILKHSSYNYLHVDIEDLLIQDAPFAHVLNSSYWRIRRFLELLRATMYDEGPQTFLPYSSSHQMSNSRVKLKQDFCYYSVMPKPISFHIFTRECLSLEDLRINRSRISYQLPRANKLKSYTISQVPHFYWDAQGFSTK